MTFTLLIVDDDAEMLKLLRLSFEEEGYRVVTAPNGREALRLAANLPDLILLDVKMPGIDGIQVCQKIKHDPALRHIPVIMLTARRIEEGLDPALTAKANWYMEKPFDFSELLFHVKAFLRQGPGPEDRPTRPTGEQFL